MRQGWFTVPVILIAAACSSPGPSPSVTSASEPEQAIHVNPDNIRRMRGSFPAGYEVTDVQGPGSPAKYWGLQPGWSSDPSQCTPLADPVSGSSTPKGLSGSGAGGIVYAVVGTSSARGPDASVTAACGHWEMVSGRTTATVDLSDGPRIDGVPTVGMVTAIRTVVEGGTETDLHATTATAYLGEYVAFVTVVTDPGAGPPALPPDFASTLLTKTVATLRG